MDLWTAGGVTLDHCVRCKGLWFDANELTRHLTNLGSRSPERELETGLPTPLGCPNCEGERLIEGWLHNVSVETCPLCHGIFLDLGEVHELLGALNRPSGAADRRSSTSGFDNFALGLFLGMRNRSED
jgi:Zn-finger nucleic acid-binding protein